MYIYIFQYIPICRMIYSHIYLHDVSIIIPSMSIHHVGVFRSSAVCLCQVSLDFPGLPRPTIKGVRQDQGTNEMFRNYRLENGSKMGWCLWLIWCLRYVDICYMLIMVDVVDICVATHKNIEVHLAFPMLKHVVTFGKSVELFQIPRLNQFKKVGLLNSCGFKPICTSRPACHGVVPSKFTDSLCTKIARQHAPISTTVEPARVDKRESCSKRPIPSYWGCDHLRIKETHH